MACRSSSSCTGSPLSAQETTTRVGARSSFAAPSGPAASFSRPSAPGPTTRKRQGAVRWWLGAQRASSSSSSISSRGERLGREGLVGAPGPDRGLDLHGRASVRSAARLPAEAAAQEAARRARASPVGARPMPTRRRWLGRSRFARRLDSAAAAGRAGASPPRPPARRAGGIPVRPRAGAARAESAARRGLPAPPAWSGSRRAIGGGFRSREAAPRSTGDAPGSAVAASRRRLRSRGTGHRERPCRPTAASAWPVTQTGVWSLASNSGNGRRRPGGRRGSRGRRRRPRGPRRGRPRPPAFPAPPRRSTGS